MSLTGTAAFDIGRVTDGELEWEWRAAESGFYSPATATRSTPCSTG